MASKKLSGMASRRARDGAREAVGRPVTCRALLLRLAVSAGAALAPVCHEQAVAQAAPAPSQPPGCEVKGNVGRGNLRLYYLPDHPLYAKVLISKKGERWFCSEAEAIAAGWQRAGSRGDGRLDAEDCREPMETHPPGCDIKGNVNSHGERIYHVRCSRFYSETSVRPELGERWFCTPAEAEAAGWRAPRNAAQSSPAADF